MRRNNGISCEQTLHYFTSIHPRPKLPTHWVENPRVHLILHHLINYCIWNKKTPSFALALQSIKNELNSELTNQYKDCNRINTLICTLL